MLRVRLFFHHRGALAWRVWPRAAETGLVLASVDAEAVVLGLRFSSSAEPVNIALAVQ
jgi:hypothetical protein